MKPIPQVCPIWATTATVERQDGLLFVLSPRAAGKYLVSDNALKLLESLPKDLKARLTHWLIDQRRQGDACPKVTSYTLEHISTLLMPTIVERRDRILDFMAESTRTITPRLQIAGAVTDKAQQKIETLVALTTSQSLDELKELIGFAKEDELISGNETLQLTFKGWNYLEERRTKQIASIQSFVAMWFDDKMNTVFEQGFARAIRDSGYEPMRIDRKEHINKIDDEIITEIRRSRFLIADFTSEPNHLTRAGAYTSKQGLLTA